MKIQLKTYSLLVLLLILPLIPLSAQGQNEHLFHFVQDNDMFYGPWYGNEAALDSLLSMITTNRSFIDQGRMYIYVSSYASTGTDAHTIGYLRSQRVKSELIIRGGLSEKCFVTNKVITKPYNGQRDVVVVVLPASVEKMEAIAGAQPTTEPRPTATEPKPKVEPETAANHPVTPPTSARTSPAPLSGHPTQLCANTLALRANLLRWATLTPNLGIEWRINPHIGILVDGTWTSWSWDKGNRRHALWNVSPAIHYYIGNQKQWYVGAAYHIGEFNYKLDSEGKQGDHQGGSLTGGYQLKLNPALSLDFNLGLGYTCANYDTYTLTDDVRVRTGKETKNYWGINQLGITLVWKIVK